MVYDYNLILILSFKETTICDIPESEVLNKIMCLPDSRLVKSRPSFACLSVTAA